MLALIFVVMGCHPSGRAGDSDPHTPVAPTPDPPILGPVCATSPLEGYGQGCVRGSSTGDTTFSDGEPVAGQPVWSFNLPREDLTFEVCWSELSLEAACDALFGRPCPVMGDPFFDVPWRYGEWTAPTPVAWRGGLLEQRTGRWEEKLVNPEFPAVPQPIDVFHDTATGDLVLIRLTRMAYHFCCAGVGYTYYVAVGDLLDLDLCVLDE